MGSGVKVAGDGTYNAAIQHVVSDPGWQALHAHLGDSVLFFYLTTASIFCPVRGGAMLQICGCPVSTLTWKHRKVWNLLPCSPVLLLVNDNVIMLQFVVLRWMIGCLI